MYTNYEGYKRVKYYIDRCGMTHGEIRRKIDICKSGFSRRYHGQIRWRTDELKRLAEVIGCSFYDLME